MKTLVTYFSYSGVTKKMAEVIAKHTGGDLFRIAEKTAYSPNYNVCVNQGKDEKNKEARPALKEDIPDARLNEYDVIFVGYPIWWYDALMIIYSFLEAHDFKGKIIVPFATSGGSGFSGSEEKIASITGATVKKGLLLGSYIDEAKIEKWLKAVELN